MAPVLSPWRSARRWLAVASAIHVVRWEVEGASLPLVRKESSSAALQPEHNASVSLQGCGMGMGGTCSESAMWVSQLMSFSTGNAGTDKYFTTFFKAFSAVVPNRGYAFCIGDRASSWVVGDEQGVGLYDSYQALTLLKTMPMSPTAGTEWGTLGVWMTIPCMDNGLTYKQMRASFAFNKCGTGVNFVMSFDPRPVVCFMSDTDPVQKAIKEVVNLVFTVTFGISLDRLFYMSGWLGSGDGDGLTTGQFSTSAHFYFAMTMGYSLGKLLGGDFQARFGDVLGFMVTGSVAVNFQAAAAISSLTNILNSQDMMRWVSLFAGIEMSQRMGPLPAALSLEATGTHGDVVTVVRGMMNGIMMVKMSGSLTLDLWDITHNILPNMAFSVGEMVMAIKTSPKSNTAASSSIESFLPGAYFSQKVSAGAFVSDIINSLVQQLSGVLDAAGVDTSAISVPGSAGIGFVINTEAIGFIMDISVVGSMKPVRCIYKYSNSKLQCKFELSWVELLWDGAKYVLNKISGFGGSVTEKIADIAVNQVGAVGQRFSNTVVDGAKSAASSTITNAANSVGSAIGVSGRRRRRRRRLIR